MVRIFPAFSRMRKNAGKMQTRITPNTDTFYAVWRKETSFEDWTDENFKPTTVRGIQVF